MELKTCTECHQPKPETNFPITHRATDGHPYRRAQCRSCYRKTRPGCSGNWEVRARQSASPQLLSKIILTDAKRSDKKKGLANDLTEDFVREQIVKPCTYCEETSIRMTLDRIDNSLGHLQTNVVPACIRCNYIRRDMPYEAWIALAPVLKAAREQGLFRDWIGRARTLANPRT